MIKIADFNYNNFNKYQNKPQPKRQVSSRSRRMARRRFITRIVLLLIFLALVVFGVYLFREWFPAGEDDTSSVSSVVTSTPAESSASSGEVSSDSSVPDESSEPDEPVGGTPDSGGAIGVGIDYLMLVNAKNPVPAGFKPELDEIQSPYRLEATAAKAYREMIAAAEAEGIYFDLISGYRSVDTQTRLYNAKVGEYVSEGFSREDAEKEAARWVAPPGYSEHNTGLAVDIVSRGYYNTHSDLTEAFAETEQFEWLYSNCARFGFVLRYPKDKQDITGITYEPWHYRYVGEKAAKEIMSSGVCLEEYVSSR